MRASRVYITIVFAGALIIFFSYSSAQERTRAEQVDITWEEAELQSGFSELGGPPGGFSGPPSGFGQGDGMDQSPGGFGQSGDFGPSQ